MKETLVLSLMETVQKYADKPAMHYKFKGVYKSINYKNLWTDLKRFARGLYSLGVRPDDKVALIAENGPKWVIADWGIIALRAVTVPLFPSSTPEQIGWILNHSSAKVIVVGSPKLAERVKIALASVNSDIKMIILDLSCERAMPYDAFMELSDSCIFSDSELIEGFEKAKPSDPITIVYTSGTTGEPKGVMLNHKNYLANITDAIKSIPFTTDDRWLCFLPLNHVFARLADHFVPLTLGATVYYAENIASIRSDLTYAKPTVMIAVPRFLDSMKHSIVSHADKQGGMQKAIFHWALKVGAERVKMLTAKKKPSWLNEMKNSYAEKWVFSKVREKLGGELRLLVSGGAALADSTAEFYLGMGINLLQGYGLTETTCVVSANRVEDNRLGTVGPPFPTVQVKIAEDGEILCKGPCIMRGYYNNPTATAEAINDDGWFHTGDIGEIIDGYIKITDRKKELLVLTNGKNVAPQPIENLLKFSNFIEEAVVVGDGQPVVSALITLNLSKVDEWAAANGVPKDRKSLSADPHLREHIKKEIDSVNKRLAEYERVRKFVILSESFSIDGGELTPTLKLKRRVIREKYKSVIEQMHKNES